VQPITASSVASAKQSEPKRLILHAGLTQAKHEGPSVANSLTRRALDMAYEVLKTLLAYHSTLNQLLP